MNMNQADIMLCDIHEKGAAFIIWTIKTLYATQTFTVGENLEWYIVLYLHFSHLFKTTHF